MGQSALVEPVAIEPVPAPAPRPRTRVLHVINGEHYAGAERVQDLLALRLPDEGYEVEFVCLKPGSFDARRQSRVPLCTFEMRGRWDFRPAVQIARRVKQGGFALVHTHTPRTAMVGSVAAMLARVPLVHHFHGQTVTEVGRHVLRRINAWVERKCIARASAAIAVSGTTREYALRQSVPSRLVRLVNNGIPPRGDLPPVAPPRGTWRLGTLALFRPRKGLEVLLEALSLVRRSGLNVQLRAVGPFETPEYQSEVHRRCQELGVTDLVEWPGFAHDIYAELARMDLFVFPSLLPEGLPMVVLEAMTAGVPVVGSRVDGITDALGDGQAGWLAEPGDPADLAAAIEAVVTGRQDWLAMRAAGHRRQREEFSDRRMAQGVAEIYRDVLGVGGRQ